MRGDEGGGEGGGARTLRQHDQNLPPPPSPPSIPGRTLVAGACFETSRMFRNMRPHSPSASVVLLASYNIQRNNTTQHKLIPILLYAIPSLT